MIKKIRIALLMAGCIGVFVFCFLIPAETLAASSTFEISPLNPTIHVNQSYKMETLTLTAVNPPGNCTWNVTGADYTYHNNTSLIIGKNYWTPFPQVVTAKATCGGMTKTSIVTFVWN